MEYIRTLTKQLDVGPEAELSIDNRTGSVTVGGDETQQVRVEVIARLWAESEDEADDQAELIERGIRQEGKRVTIRAPVLVRSGLLMLFGRGPRIDYEVTTPQATKLTIANRTGRVEAENVAGPLQVEASTGRIGARNIGGNVGISSRTGSVQTESIAGTLSIESRSGGIKVSRCEGNVTVQARTGSVQIEDVGGKLKVETRTGSVRYEGQVQEAFDIGVRTGSVRLALDPSSTFFLDAETRTGSVRSDLSLRRRAGTPAERAGGPTVRIRTRSGSIHIVAR